MANKRDTPPGVGYGKPPAHTRFQKGRSGNPKGRPSGTKNKATVLEQALDQTVHVNQGGKRLIMTKWEAAATQLANKAAAGDIRSIQILLAVRRQSAGDGGPLEESAPGELPLDEIEQQVFENLLARLHANGAPNGDGKDQPS